MFLSRLRPILRAFIPDPALASRRERLLGSLGALTGLASVEAVSHVALGEANPWFIAPMGASAVLLFAVPASPLAQPWPLLGGNLAAALIGVVCAHYIPLPGLAAGVAAAAAILAMFWLRCVHPPSGAVALTAVIGGPKIAALGYGFILVPVAVNSVLLLLIALLFNNALRRPYPHKLADILRPAAAVPVNNPVGATRADFDAVLTEKGEMLDISEADLENVLSAVEARVLSRHIGNLACRELMTRDPVSVQPEMTAADAMEMLSAQGLASAPVADENGQLAGRVWLDYLRRHAWPDMRVRQAMISDHATVRPQSPAADLVEHFIRPGAPDIAVTDERNRLVGMISAANMVAGLSRALIEHGQKKAGGQPRL